MTPTDLGPLAFKRGDFYNGTPFRDDLDFEDNLIELANRILAEKLAKAPVVYAGEEVGGFWVWRRVDDQATHSARLVCIEEIKK